MDLKSKILDYEQNIFNEFTEKRNKLIKHINEIVFSVLTQSQLNNFICDIKMVLDPLKSSLENMDNILTNTNFNNNNSHNDIKDFQNIILLYSILNQNRN
jgi:hypothetical protein